MDQIKINNLEVYCNHGVFEEENRLGQKFLVSAKLSLNTKEAGTTDDITKSIHYGEVCHFITDFMKKNTFKLIESVAENLATELLLNITLLKEISIEIKKPWAPIGLPLENVAIDITRSWHKAYIALGSNMGEKESYLKDAIEEFRKNKSCRVKKVSSFIETEPYGPVEQDKFLNGCMELETILSPYELLALIGEIENNANRRREVHWGPRTLDLDIIFYDDLILAEDKLIIPHIEMHKRSFVLEPLVEIAPYAIHPVLKKCAIELCEQVSRA